MKLLDLTQPDLDALVEERDRLRAALANLLRLVEVVCGFDRAAALAARPQYLDALDEARALVREPGR